MGPGIDAAEATEFVNALKQAPVESIETILRSLMQNIEMFHDQFSLIDELMRLLQSNMLGQSREQASLLDPDLIIALYDNLQAEQKSRFILLHCLAIARTPEHLRLLTETLVRNPPASWVQSGLILSPLFQHDDWDVSDVFPDALDALEHSAVASVLLDLANHLTRGGRSGQTHVASDRSEELIGLLGGLVARLEQAQQDPDSAPESAQKMDQMVGESVALIVSLCDALALIGDDTSIPTIRSAMTLPHRRIQTEAAGALARLEQDDGIERLLSLASEPVARLRVLAYAEELGLSDGIAESHKTPEARAESELALWLSQPSQMTVPPSRIELVDKCSQFWPGFEEPIDCFLLEFEYWFGDQRYRNLGIAGPLVHAFEADLTHLDQFDAYAAFAGWQAEHPDIYEVPVQSWNSAQQQVSSELVRGLEKQGYESITPEFLGFFFGEHALVTIAHKEQRNGICVTDGLETLWFAGSRLRPLSLADGWNIYKGRKLLRSFN